MGGADQDSRHNEETPEERTPPGKQRADERGDLLQ